MNSPTDNEIMGGIGYGNDQYSFPYDSNFTIYGNGSTYFNRDPYIPIENENMGRQWSADNYDSSDPCTQKIYPYRDVFTPSDSMIRKDYYLDSPVVKSGKRLNTNPIGKKEGMLATNVGTFHSIDPFISDMSQQINDKGKNNNTFIFMFMLFIIVIVIAYIQHLQIMHLQDMLIKKT